MNKLRFKLVFSKRLGMLVPIAEISRSHQKTASPAPASLATVELGSNAHAFWRISSGSAALLLAGCLSWMSAPILAMDANTLPTGGNIVYGTGSIRVDGSTMNVNTLTNRAIIRWDSFNIGANAGVNFRMPDASSSVLNRVMGNSASLINGMLNANGHVYIVNQNGIYFGAGSQVNVGSLTATALDNIANNAVENIYNNGILSNTDNPVFSFADAVGVIDVAKGASISTSLGGRVMLLAPDVKNSGVIYTPDGQTILAAGKTVYLSTLDKFAGLLVEVSSGGTATNLGDIIVNHGNASLVGLAVNQQGKISASTSVRANGSIFLKAEQILAKKSPGDNLYGKVTLGKDSQTSVTIDVNDKEEIIDAQKLPASVYKLDGSKDVKTEVNGSVINIQGKDISIDGTVTANSGNVYVTATDIQNNNGSIYLGEHALIDVSGVDAVAAMSRNQLAIQLFSDQLRDSPALRGGALFGEMLYLDARKGTKLVSQDVIDEAMAGVTRTIAERATNGGQVNFSAVNLVAKSGSTIDMSAGTTTYTGGTIRESRVLFNNQWILASDARSGVSYQGINDKYTVNDARWGESRSWTLTASAANGFYQPTYQAGGDAGSLNIATTNMAYQGSVLATTTAGVFQRGDWGQSKTPLGGLFNLTYNNAGVLNFVTSPGLLGADFNENSTLSDVQKQTAEIDVGMLSTGVNRIHVNAAGQVNIDASMQFKPQGELVVDGNAGVNVKQNVILPSGELKLSASQTADVVVSPNVLLSVAGLFTNDTLGITGSMQGLVSVNGGKITISDGLQLGQGATLDASSGFWLNNQKQITAGHGGDITVTLANNKIDSGSFKSYGVMVNNHLSEGGSLVLNLQGDGGTGEVNDIQLGGANPGQNPTLWLSEGFFKEGGFSSYTVSNQSRANGDVLIGDTANHVVTIQPEQRTRIIAPSAMYTQSGSALSGVTRAFSVVDGFRSPASLTVVAGDDLTLASNARIQTDTPISLNGNRGDVHLSSVGQMTILGDITAPAADISLAIISTASSGRVAGAENGQFDNTLSLFVGEQASLDARGYYINPPSIDGSLKSAQVADAGTITLAANNGTVIVKEGAVLNVSATQGAVDLPVAGGYQRFVVDGNAGTLNISARDGMALDGTLLGRTAGQGEAGTLNLTLGGSNAPGRENDSATPLYFTNGKRLIYITQAKELLAANNTAGGSVSNLINTSAPSSPLTNAVGIAQISADQISQGGFDNVSLKTDNVSNIAGDQIRLVNGVALNVPSVLTLDSSTVAGAGNVAASTLVLRNSDALDAAAAVTLGSGSMNMHANFIDIQGSVFVSEVASTVLQSRTDIRGVNDGPGLSGKASLTVPSQLTLDAAQIYPSTATDFTVTATGTDSKIIVNNSQNAASSVPLSAGGSLTLKADNILQSGTLRAPLGQITLDAKQQLTLSAGSKTSVSAEGSLIPYAATVLGGNKLAENTGEENIFLTQLKEKKVTLNGNNVDMQADATVDISGGGDTFAFEWIKGIGGSLDILNQPGYYAVLPGLNSYAPYDKNLYAGSDVTIGQAIYLSGGNGLAAGTYTLLPAKYALVPGAYLVKANGGNLQLNTKVAQLDGSVLSSGYLTKLDGTSRDQYSSFNILNGNVFYKDYGTKNYKGLADYLITSGNSFIANKAIQDGRSVPRLASDAGQLVISANSSLNLGSELLTSSATGAKGALVDISSNDIRVVSTVDPSQSGVLQLSANQLNNIKADSVLLGGSRTTTGSTQTVTTTANNVKFSNDAAHAVQLDELIVASKDTITLDQGAVIKTGPKSGTIGKTTLTTSGDGALLALSAKNDFDFSRSGVSDAPVNGTLTVSEGASLNSARSMVLDATAAFDQSGNIEVADGGTVTLGANQFSIGDQPVTGATKISSETLADFGRLSAMAFNSYKNIDIAGASSFGNNAMNITFNTAGISHQGAGDVNIVADSFVLKNTSHGVYTAPASLNGQLTVNAKQISFGETGSVSTNIGGFNQVNLNASKDVRVAGAGTLNIHANQTNVNSAVITADSGARYSLVTTGSLTTQNNGQQVENASGIGATLNLTAADMQLGGNLVLNAGELNATARSGNLQVVSGGVINVASATKAFDEVHSATTDAGNIHLTSDHGNVEVENNALVNLAGGQTSGKAGALQVDAKNGRFVIADGTLNGQAAKGEKTASLKLDVGDLGNFSDVNKALESGHFNESRDIRVRHGDVTIATGDTVTAHEFTLGVDNGSATVAGHINADGDKGGDVAIYANGLVKLAGTAQITARGQQVNKSGGDLHTGSGGSVLLSSDSLSTTNAVSAAAGALIDTSGYSASDNGNAGVDGYDGSVTLRGRRGTNGTANTVNVAFNTTAAIKGANEVNIEGTRTYTASSFATTTMAGMIADTNSFYNANTGSVNYAATQDGTVAKVLPHIEVRSTAGNTEADLAVGADVNLRSFGTLLAGRGGSLTLRSNGNLTFNGSLSDGFSTATSVGVLQPNANTFNFNLIAGADYSAANITETKQGTGNFTLANSKLIRTGEGDITIAAGDSMSLGNEASVIYTVGKASTLLNGFTPAASTTSATTYGITSASYLKNGGDITIDIAGNITGAETNQTVNQWLARQGGGTLNKDVSWWIRPDRFQQGIAALGGGDVVVNAGGSVKNLSLSSATNAQFVKTIVDGKEVFTSLINGGGDVMLNAQGNIENGVYYVGRGNLDIATRGDLFKTPDGSGMGTMIALQDASAKVSALGSAQVDTVFNPTLWAQANFTSTSGLLSRVDGSNTFFSTYAPDSSFTISSLTGNVAIGLESNAVIQTPGSGVNALLNAVSIRGSTDTILLHPGTVNAIAYNGDMAVNKMTLAPSSQGSLTLLAKGSVVGAEAGVGSSSDNNLIDQVLGISDADISNILNVYNPVALSASSPVLFEALRTVTRGGHAATPVHVGQNNQAIIVAEEGNILFKGKPANSDRAHVFGIQTAMPLYLSAGKDVTINAAIQHNASNNVSYIRAGNDFVMDNGQPYSRVEISGPGELVIEAGRNIDLGNTAGILSLANTANPNLPASGANITMLAGLGKEGAAIGKFIDVYIDPDGSGPEGLQATPEALAAYRAETATSVQTFMNRLTGEELSTSEAMTRYLSLDKTTQAVFAYRHFSNELLSAGKTYIENGSTTRSDAAIATLFPTASTYNGDMLMYQSQVRTTRDSSIDLLAPGGLINAGVAVTPAGKKNVNVSRVEPDIGIVTEKGGAIRAFSDGAFQVNQSKVITQFGSDIMVWSNNGDIDAGRGSKTAISVPQREVGVDALDGKVNVEVKGVAAGSGIRAQTYDPDGPNGSLTSPGLGTVALFAPRGVLDAGEAGIAAGNLLIGAITVLNSTNITVAGTSAGVPVADTGSLAGSLAGVTSTAAGVSNAMTENLANQMGNQNVAPKELPPIVTVKTIRLED